jgi:hypothetical protein
LKVYGLSQSQKSDFGDNMTANNSKLEQLEKLENYGEICFQDNQKSDKNQNQFYDPDDIDKKKMEAEIQKQLQEDDEEDLRD